MSNFDYLLVSTKALPEVFDKVAYAKSLIDNKIVTNISLAAKKAHISRSTYYKYKDYIFIQSDSEKESAVNLSAVLSHKAGVFSALTAELFESGFNILAINQSLPIDGTAAVSLSLKAESGKITLEELLAKIRNINGIISVNVM